MRHNDNHQLLKHTARYELLSSLSLSPSHTHTLSLDTRACIKVLDQLYCYCHAVEFLVFPATLRVPPTAPDGTTSHCCS